MNSPNFNLVSIILPTYNERDNIVPLIKALQKEVKFKKEIIVVDDDSPDGTSETVKKYIKRNHKTAIKLITRTKNRGLTNSIQEGIKNSRGDVVCWMDCDFSMPPDTLNKLLNKVNAGYDIAVGSRFVKGGRFKEVSKGKKDSKLVVLLSRLMNYSIQYLLGGGFKDYTSGFVAVKLKVLKKIHLRGDYGEYFIDFIYRALGENYKVVEVPYVCLPREKGESKTGQNLYQLLRRGSKYIILTFRLLIERRILKKFP